jgi:hypothetical protein
LGSAHLARFGGEAAADGEAVLSEIALMASFLKGKKEVNRKEYVSLLSSARILLETVRDKIEETNGGETVL